MWVVRVALQRPYLFVVLALRIAIFGVLAALNTPTDIFPSLNIPVVSVVWTDNGLFPNDMSGREPASLAPEPGRLRIKFFCDGFRRLNHRGRCRRCFA